MPDHPALRLGDAPDRRDALFGENQTHTLQVYDAHLWAGMWPQGKVLRYEGGVNPGRWTDTGQLGINTDTYRINEVNDLTVYNGKMYAGVIPLGENRLDLANDQPLLIGSGAQGPLAGWLSDVRLYDRALDPRGVLALAESS